MVTLSKSAGLKLEGTPRSARSHQRRYVHRLPIQRGGRGNGTRVFRGNLGGAVNSVVRPTPTTTTTQISKSWGTPLASAPTGLPRLAVPYTLSGDARRDFERRAHLLLPPGHAPGA